MEVIRLQNKVPETYVMQSRDFQLLCRLYDVVNNSTKFDVDGIKKITDTRKIRSNLLPLLQTKLGFFSNASTDDVSLRLILEAFPTIIKSKGSLKSIQEILNVYLKVIGERVPLTITKTESDTQLYNIVIPEHTIVIGLNTAFKNTSQIFKDLLSYVLPAGFGSYIYFYSSMKELSNLIYKDSVAIIYISDDINSLIRSSSDDYNNIENRMIGNVSLMEVEGSMYFSSASSYAIGDVVLYQNAYYKCISSIDASAPGYTGEWDSSKWEVTSYDSSYNSSNDLIRIVGNEVQEDE